MDDLAKAVSTFLTRDAIYIVCGTVVLASAVVLFRFDIPIASMPPAFVLVLFGLGHFVGFAIQSLGVIIGMVTVAADPAPTPFLRFLVWRFTGRTLWYSSDPLVDARFAEFASQRSQAELDRIITLKQISATMGACSVVIAILIVWKWCLFPGIHTPAMMAFVGAVALGSTLCPLSYIMAVQQGQYVAGKGLEERTRNMAASIWRARVAKGEPGDADQDWQAAKAGIRDEAERRMSGRP